MEFGEHRTPWHDSTISITNLRGRTSHEKWPLIFAGTSGFSEQQGEVWGCHLGWSGNFEITADGVTEHHKHLLVSERLVAGEIILQPGDSYTAPTIYAVHSTNGLSGASQHFHQYVRSLPQHLETERPIIINTWEAVYFDHDLKTLTALADVAASIGVERFVLDDGWFTGRRNDSAGLGDWSVDATVWPQGLTPLIEHVRSRNMQFGIWFEPEMVSVNSDLYRKHPDWALHDANYGQITGRNQLVLDMSRADVRDYLYAHISKLLDEHDIAYIKWDHNRDLVATGAHAQTLGTYELLDRLKRKHPLVQFESCASGGGRIDFGILPHVSRFWTSDSIDALDRTLIQRGATRLMPHEILGSHIGSRVNHITRRSHSLAFRASTAIFGWLGIESNLLTAPPEEIARLTEVIAKYKSLRPLIHTGSSFNEDHPDTNIVVHGVSNSDGLSTIVSITRLNNGQSNHIDPIRIHDLEPQAEYRISPIYFGTPAFSPHRQLPQWMEDASFSMSGLQLQQIGFICPPLLPASSFIVMLERVMS
jgi:alpha-galactosidase